MIALLNRRRLLNPACLIAILCSSAAVWNANSSSKNETTSSNDLDGIKTGLTLSEPGAYPGYTLISPVNRTQTWLIDMDGRIVHQWNHDARPSLSAELLANGHLLRCAQLKRDADPGPRLFEAPGKIQEFDWNGELLWDFQIPIENLIQHHDCIKLPNGNVMVVARVRKAIGEAADFGWIGAFPDNTPYFPADCILEIKQTGKKSGQIVWRWNVFDHILQDVDPTRPNFVKPDEVTTHPELINLNYQMQDYSMLDRKTPALLSLEADALKSIGYMDAGRRWRSTSTPTRNPDWTHFNSVSYNAHLDQVMISVREFSEFWIIDHSCTTAQAAGHAGGRHGKGGDLLYRWGNPATYRCGTPQDQILFFQHNAHWIPDGLPGAGHILTFNNGGDRPGGVYSTIEEVVPTLEDVGAYSKAPQSSFGPSKPLWTFAAEDKKEFYSSQLAGAQRLPNGNTLICSGIHGIIFEATPECRLVWKYVIPPFVGTVPPSESDWEGVDSKPKPATDDKGVHNGQGLNPLRSSLFRAYRYGADFPAFADKKLQPGILLQDWEP